MTLEQYHNENIYSCILTFWWKAQNIKPGTKNKPSEGTVNKRMGTKPN